MAEQATVIHWEMFLLGHSDTEEHTVWLALCHGHSKVNGWAIFMVNECEMFSVILRCSFTVQQTNEWFGVFSMDILFLLSFRML